MEIHVVQLKMQPHFSPLGGEQFLYKGFCLGIIVELFLHNALGDEIWKRTTSYV